MNGFFLDRSVLDTVDRFSVGFRLNVAQVKKSSNWIYIHSAKMYNALIDKN